MTSFVSKSVKTIKKVEKPRPLRSISDSQKFDLLKEQPGQKRSVSDQWLPTWGLQDGFKGSAATRSSSTNTCSYADVIPQLEHIYVELCNSNFDERTSENILNISNILKTYGQELDSNMKNMLDHYFVTLRNVSREERLDAISRLRLLELIEIKASGWQVNENIHAYYRRKIGDLEGTERGPVALSQSQSCSSLISQAFPEPSSPIPVPLAPGEIIRSSGKYMNPTKIAGKNYFKDEVVIRNSDSGKVMGIKGRRVHMIEELSDTIISFQRVNPGARDRRVQIAGPNEESISYAKTLVEDTIRRNASPVRERNDNSNIELNNSNNLMSSIKVEDMPFSKPLMHSFSVGDATNECVLSVHFFGDNIKLTGKNLELLQLAKNVLEEKYQSQEIPVQQLRTTSLTENFPKSKFNKHPGNSLQRSISCTESFNGCSQTSISPLETSSDEEISKDGDCAFKVPDMEEAPAFLDGSENVPPPIPPPRMMYVRDTLLYMRQSPFCKILPPIDPEIWKIYPMMQRDNVQIETSSQENSG